MNHDAFPTSQNANDVAKQWEKVADEVESQDESSQEAQEERESLLRRIGGAILEFLGRMSDAVGSVELDDEESGEVEVDLEQYRAQILQLEDELFKYDRDSAAAYKTANILGVLSGIKPVSLVTLVAHEDRKDNLDRIEKIIRGLGLKIVHSKYGEKRRVPDIDLFISKSEERALLARDTLDEVQRMRAAKNKKDGGVGENNWKWAEYKNWADTRFGKLMGYPDTAVEAFLNWDETMDELSARAHRSRYYTHSREHEQEEYEAFDKRLDQVVAEYAPRTAAYFSSEEDVPWL